MRSTETSCWNIRSRCDTCLPQYTHKIAAGLITPPQNIEEELLEITRRNGTITTELKKIE